MVAIALAILLFMLLFMLMSWEYMRGYASTYDDSSWWLGTDSNHRAGDVDVIYTYPNITQATKLPTVGVTLKYIKNEDAHADWVIFSNVSVYISSSPTAAKVATSNIHTSKLVRPGEQYSDSFPITSTHPVNPGRYLVFLKWRALFDLEDSVEPYNWDAALYYNQSYPPHIDINDLPPITVKNQDHNEPTQQPSLVVEVKRPLGVFNNLTKVYIDKQPYELIQGKVERLFNLNYRTTVEVPKNITDINRIKGYREIFVSWSDGDTHHQRDVILNRSLELYALYKPQYNLAINSNCSPPLFSLVCGDPPNGGWYDSGNTTQLSVDSPSSPLWLQSFDHWSGDIPSDQRTSSHITLLMNGPKDIRAHWKWDYQSHLAVVGSVIVLQQHLE